MNHFKHWAKMFQESFPRVFTQIGGTLRVQGAHPCAPKHTRHLYHVVYVQEGTGWTSKVAPQELAIAETMLGIRAWAKRLEFLKTIPESSSWFAQEIVDKTQPKVKGAKGQA